jgi:hypothetical protein
LKKLSPSSSGAPPSRAPITVPRGLGSSMVMIAVMCAPLIKIRPRFPDGARRTSARAAIVVHIVTAAAAVKLSLQALESYARCESRK